jgi:hypothetical protein
MTCPATFRSPPSRTRVTVAMPSALRARVAARRAAGERAERGVRVAMPDCDENDKKPAF